MSHSPDSIWYPCSSDESCFLRRGGVESQAFRWKGSLEKIYGGKQRETLWTDPEINEELVWIAENGHSFTLKFALSGLILMFLLGIYIENH